jgi:hypothetical protein
MTFRISIWKRLLALVLLGCCAVLLAAVAMHFILQLRTGAVAVRFRQALFVLLPSLSLFASMSLFLLRMLGARIHISDQGIAYRPGGILRARFVPWDDVLSVKWRRRRVSRILLENGRHIYFGGLEGQEELARMVRDELAEVDAPERWLPESSDFREVFRLSAEVRNMQVAFYCVYAIIATFLLIWALIWHREDWGIRTAVLLIALLLVASLTAIHSMRRYNRVRIEISPEGIRCFDQITGKDRSSAILRFRRRIPWDNIVEVVRYMGGRGALLLSDGNVIPITGIEREEVFLHLAEARLEMLEREGRKTQLMKLRKGPVIAFVIFTLVFASAIAAILLWTL